jgi:hypothetical protein
MFRRDAGLEEAHDRDVVAHVARAAPGRMAVNGGAAFVDDGPLERLSDLAFGSEKRLGMRSRWQAVRGGDDPVRREHDAGAPVVTVEVVVRVPQPEVDGFEWFVMIWSPS